MSGERAHRALLFASAIAAAACIAELFWLRSAQVEVTRPVVALLFLPWLAAAAANLGVWYVTLTRGKPSPLKRASTVIFWIVTAAFAAGFVALYGWVLLGGA